MREAYVQLLCPDCAKAWESTPDDLPAAADDFSCPDCGTTRRTAEFLRTDRDLQVLADLG